MSGERSNKIVNWFIAFSLAIAFAFFALILLPDQIKRTGKTYNQPKFTTKKLSSIVSFGNDQRDREIELSGSIARFVPEPLPTMPGNRYSDSLSAEGMENVAGGPGEAIDGHTYESLQARRDDLSSDEIKDGVLPPNNFPGNYSLSSVSHSKSSLAKNEPSALATNKSKKGYGWIYPPKELEADVAFWRDVYAKYDNNNVVLHHPVYLDIVYDVVDLSPIDRDRRLTDLEKEYKKEKLVEDRRDQVTSILRKLAKNPKSSSLSDHGWEIKKLFQGVTEQNKYLKAADEYGVRAQYGQKDKFISGLKYSGRYLGEIEDIYEEYGLPRELTRLIFVESMFNPKARSFVGASGLWQFMPNTGKLYLRINDIVDERNDPLTATRASAKLLRHNFNDLKTWPLAINAYNAGRGRLSQAVKRLGTRDIAKIVKNFKHSAYGFASRNFFMEFLAALEIVENVDNYFGQIQYDKPLRYEVVKSSYHLSLPNVAKLSGIPMDELLEYNAGFTAKVASGKQLVPIGFPIRVPEGKGDFFLAAAARAPKSRTGDIKHVVKKGESLNTIASMYGVDPDKLQKINKGIRRKPSRGQIIRIPFNR
ncbi:MAG: transglycosylase SLT domain-containing protein [Deltaproteobacteria bacterium]|jgi:hypothetical protein|nr:transglycosylase SLT domain-containing protein [Deltaproteobacteria bacterium]